MTDQIMQKLYKKAWEDLNKAIEESKIGFANDQATQFAWFFLTDLDKRIKSQEERIELFHDLAKGLRELIGLTAGQQELIGLLNQQIGNQKKDPDNG